MSELDIFEENVVIKIDYKEHTLEFEFEVPSETEVLKAIAEVEDVKYLKKLQDLQGKRPKIEQKDLFDQLVQEQQDLISLIQSQEGTIRLMAKKLISAPRFEADDPIEKKMKYITGLRRGIRQRLVAEFEQRILGGDEEKKLPSDGTAGQ